MIWKNALFVQDLCFQMKTHFMGGRTQVPGNVVNVPVDVAPTVLPFQGLYLTQRSL